VAGEFDWGLVEQNAGLLHFRRRLIDFRKRNASLRRKTFFTGKSNGRGLRDVTWHGCRLNDPGWDDPNARALAFTLAGSGGAGDLHVLLNMYWGPLDFDLLPPDGRGWHLAVDTSENAPLDAAGPGQEKRVTYGSFCAQGRSVVVLVSREHRSRLLTDNAGRALPGPKRPRPSEKERPQEHERRQGHAAF
jgi:glycogen operon protein